MRGYNLLKDKQKENFDKQYGAKALPSLKTGQLVWLPNSRVQTHVEEQFVPRSYSVNITPQGQVRRNQRDLIELSQNSKVTETNGSSLVIRRSTRESNPPQRLVSDPN